MANIETFAAELEVFCNRFGITKTECVYAPAAFEHAAKQLGMSTRQLLATATYSNQAAGEYLASVIKDVANKMAA